MKWIGKHLQEILLFLLLVVVIYQQAQINHLCEVQQKSLQAIEGIRSYSASIENDVSLMKMTLNRPIYVHEPVQVEVIP